MKLKVIIQKIEDYFSGKLRWEEFGNYYEDTMSANDSFHDMYPVSIVMILEEILYEVQFSDYTESYKDETNPNVRYEKEFKKRLKKNYKRLKHFITKGTLKEDPNRKLKEITQKIEDYFSGKMKWEEFGKDFMNLMKINNEFGNILPGTLIVILRKIQSDTESCKDEKDFKKRLKKNYKKLSQFIIKENELMDKMRKSLT